MAPVTPGQSKLLAEEYTEVIKKKESIQGPLGGSQQCLPQETIKTSHFTDDKTEAQRVNRNQHSLERLVAESGFEPSLSKWGSFPLHDDGGPVGCWEPMAESIDLSCLFLSSP